MIETWTQIEGWLDRHAPAVLTSLRGPASESAIAEAERQMGLRLPEPLRASLRRHDGQSEALGLIDGWQLFGIREIVGEWRTYEGDRRPDAWPHELDAFVTPHPWVRPVYWDARWVPVAGRGTSDVVCLDLAPTAEGTEGQVILRSKSGELTVLSPSLAIWLAVFADDLVAGRYAVDDTGLDPHEARRDGARSGGR